MSDTPRTDANEHLVAGPNVFSPYEHPVVDSGFARTLERENTALASELTQLRAVDRVALLRQAWEAGFALCRAYGDNHIHFRGEQKERQWRKLLLGEP